MIGWPIGASIGGGDANWALAGIGAGLVFMGILISMAANKNVKKAVDAYNSSFTSTDKFKPELEIFANENGVVLSMSF